MRAIHPLILRAHPYCPQRQNEYQNANAQENLSSSESCECRCQRSCFESTSTLLTRFLRWLPVVPHSAHFHLHRRDLLAEATCSAWRDVSTTGTPSKDQ